MKQHITIKQLNELSDKGKERLRKWWKPQFGDFAMENEGWHEITLGGLQAFDLERQAEERRNCHPLLSIGQMIEFLTDHDFKEQWLMFSRPEELCDDLWEVVWEVLEK